MEYLRCSKDYRTERQKVRGEGHEIKNESCENYVKNLDFS